MKKIKQLISKLLVFFVPADRLLVMRLKQCGAKQASVFGAGELGIAVVGKMANAGIGLKNWYDSSAPEGNNSFLNRPLLNIQCMTSDSDDILVIASEAYSQGMLDACTSRGFRGKIISVIED